MSTLPRQTSARTALLAALIALAGAHAPAIATPDQAIVVQTCPVAGRDPSAAMLQSSCGVWNPGGLTSVPDWDTLELMAIDGNASGAGVVVRLQCTSRTSGAVSTVALVRSVPSTRPKKVAVRLSAPLNFRDCGYGLDIKRTNAEAKALMVVLRK
ncbi:MAG TPA: hypothetical protein VF107_17885 [Burkholderiaceae bacterium]